MHIPDDSLDPWVAGLFWLDSGIVIDIAVRRVHGELGDERTSLLGVITADIFVTRMLNWPIPDRASTHFVDGVSAGILLGPYLGVLAISAVVTIQALVFSDGGIITLGADLFVMAVVDVLVGYALFRALRGVHKTDVAFVTRWGVATVSALIVGVGIGLSSAFAYKLSVIVLIMVVGHALLGSVEGVTTAAVYGYVVDARPDLILGRLDDDSLSPGVGL